MDGHRGGDTGATRQRAVGRPSGAPTDKKLSSGAGSRWGDTGGVAGSRQLRTQPAIRSRRRTQRITGLWRRRRQCLPSTALLLASLSVVVVSPVGLAPAWANVPAQSPAPSVITVNDGVTPDGLATKPFPVRLRATRIGFPTRSGGCVPVSPADRCVTVVVEITSLASKPRVVPFNESGGITLAFGLNRAIPGYALTDPGCDPPDLNGLAYDPTQRAQLSTQYCIRGAQPMEVALKPKQKRKILVRATVIVDGPSARAENFPVLIYSPSDRADPTIITIPST